MIKKEITSVEFSAGMVTGGNERFIFGEFPDDVFLIETLNWKDNGEDGLGSKLPFSPTMEPKDVARSLSEIKTRGLEIERLIAFPCDSGEIKAVVVVARKNT